MHKNWRLVPVLMFFAVAIANPSYSSKANLSATHILFTPLRMAAISEAATIPGVVAEFNIPTTSSSPWGITTGPDGNLWFTENRANKIGKITTDGVFTEFNIPSYFGAPTDIAAGPSRSGDSVPSPVRPHSDRG